MSARRLVVTGSVAFDYLMTFPGRFLDVVVPDKMHRLSVSFLVDAMRRVPGGVAPNIAYNMALLGLRPTVLATAGPDAAEYKTWLGTQGIDVSNLKLCEDVFTASFFVSTDQDQNQIATFYAGAMARASELSLKLFEPGSVELAVVGPNDPLAMASYARECREFGIPFVYDPSQQVARLSKEELLEGLEGASILIGNEYEFSVLSMKTGLTEADLITRVPVVVQTMGAEGSAITVRGDDATAVLYRIPPARLRGEAKDPTGVGDAFRAGLLAARFRGLPWEIAGRAGSVAAVFALETIGPQPPRYTLEDFVGRYRESFGDDEASGLLKERLFVV